MKNRKREKFFEKLFCEMYAPLLLYAKSVLHDAALAEDAVQETFRIATEKAESVMSCPKPNGWLVKTMRHVLFNMIRARTRYNKRVVSSDEIDYMTAQNYDEEEEKLTNLMYSDLICQEDYELLKLIVFHEYTIREVAEKLNISVEACKKRVQRIKKRIAKSIHEVEDQS